jgi:uncharacterized protein YhaN
MNSPAKAPAKESPARPMTPPIDEAIEIALGAAGTATDAAQEIQRLKKQVTALVTGSKKSSMILLYSGVLLALLSVGTVAVSIILYQQSLHKFDTLTSVNRDALAVLADEINGLTGSAKRMEEANNTTVQALAMVTAKEEELKKTYQQLTASQNAVSAKLDALNGMGDKLPAAMRQTLDELATANKAAIAQLTKAVEASGAGGSREVAAKVDSLLQAQRSISERVQRERAVRVAPRASAPREADIGIRYP